MIKPGETNTSTNSQHGHAPGGLRPVKLMSAGDCLDELAADPELHRLRALVAARRVLARLEREEFTGRLEGDVQSGRLRRWRYPQSEEAS